MSKNVFYFSHDYNVRTDEKIKKLIRKHGMEGYGIFWSIIEDLYNNANAMRIDYDDIAYDLHVNDFKIIKSVINDFGLFSIEDGSFGSISVERRLDERSKRSEKARQKAFKRWRKDIKDDTNVPESNATALKNNATASKMDAGKERIVKGKKEIFKEKNVFSSEGIIENEPFSKEKNPNPSGREKNNDFFKENRVIEQFQFTFPNYNIPTATRTKEQYWAGQLLKIFEEQNPKLSPDEILKLVRYHFKHYKNIESNWFQDNVSLSLMVNKYNEIENLKRETDPPLTPEQIKIREE